MKAVRWSAEQLQAYQQRKTGAAVTAAPARESKFGNIKVEREGRTFDSKKEAARYDVLRMMERAGLIADLECQVEYEIIPSVKIKKKQVRARFYVADFRYKRDGKVVIEDVKGMMTREYRMKRQLMKVIYDIEIEET